jgi:hypothetical protein
MNAAGALGCGRPHMQARVLKFPGSLFGSGRVSASVVCVRCGASAASLALLTPFGAMMGSLAPKYRLAASLGLRGVGPYTFLDNDGTPAMYDALDAFLSPRRHDEL